MTEVQQAMPFMGEYMTCFICKKEQLSNPGVESQWRAIDVHPYRYYVCPEHFPADDASAAEFEEAYRVVLLKILADANYRQGGNNHHHNRRRRRSRYQ